MSRPEKRGDCSKCKREPIQITWHRETSQWYCADCFPVLPEIEQPLSQKSREYLKHWDEMIEKHYGPKAAQDYRGVRVDDSRRFPGDFTVICPEHGIVADELRIQQARKLCDDHQLSHA
jgi:hypothetical protein